MATLSKAMARTLALAAREALSATEREAAATSVADQFIQWLGEQPALPRCIHVYLPIPGSAELDTTPIIQAVQDHYPSILWAVPWLLKGDQNMKTAAYVPNETILTSGPMRVPQPESPVWVPETEIDLVLLPLLAHDAQGYRAGYGKGFYDRFLQLCRPDIKTVGLSYFNATPIPLASDPWDVPCQMVLSAGLPFPL